MPVSALTSIQRLLALDFDGVSHPVGAAEDGAQPTHFCWLPHLPALLAPHPDVAVLVHSTWRYEYADGELRDLLGPVGESFVGTVPRGPRMSQSDGGCI